MIENNNQEFLNKIGKHSAYTDILSKSLQKQQYNADSFIFRWKTHWYRFEEWNLPTSGIIREWKAKDGDWIPKQQDTSKLNRKNSQIIFSLKNLPKKLQIYNIRHVTLSAKRELLLAIAEKNGIFDFLVLKKGSMVIHNIVKNIALESSFFCGEQGILFCRADEHGRPNKLYYKNFEEEQEELLFTEEDAACRLKIASAGNSVDTYFVSSMDFQKGSLFLYTFENGKPKYECLAKNRILPRLFDLVEFGGERYFLAVNKQTLFFQSLDNQNHNFNISLEKSVPITTINCVGQNIILNTSTSFNYSFCLIQLNNTSPLSYEETTISFDHETNLYENSFSKDCILFLETDGFSETLFSYQTDNQRLRKEFTQSIVDNSIANQYMQTTVWTEKDTHGVCVPISLIWRRDSSVEILPKNKNCIINVYGAYGEDDRLKPTSSVLSVVDAGFLFAVIHVRGGGFLGGDWYRSGKELHKWNSITDLIRGVKHLINQEIANSNHIGLMATSAGGIVAGAALNEEKNMFRSILLFSPFINPYDALQRDDDPLSKTEILEWGDISNPIIRNYIKTYSPMQNAFKAKESETTVISILGGRDSYISNNDVINWSQQLQTYGLTSSVYVNENAGHGGFNDEDDKLMVDVYNYFLEQVSRNK